MRRATRFQQYAHRLETGDRPRTDGVAGLCMVRILEAATRSLEERGKFVELKAQEAGA
jgi:predicted transcriptional regulator